MSLDPTPPTAHALDVVEFLAKFSGAAGIVWGFIAGVWKPYLTWRRRKLAEMMRDVLKGELTQLKTLIDKEDGCVGRLEEITLQIRELFGEHDMMLDIMLDNRDRLDETNDLLDEAGFSADRRTQAERRTEMLSRVEALAERRRARRRHIAALREPGIDRPIKKLAE